MPRDTQRRTTSGHPAPVQGMRSRSDDSWIEVASQPSSSSLSSTTSANDEIITDGLRVQHDSNARRRRQQRASRLHLDLGYRGSASTGTSSQEEYEESESESDRVMSSSNEGMPAHQELRQPGRVQYTSSDNQSDGEYEDDDENSTAVGYIRSCDQNFTPQPNAFSHPPSAPATRPSQQQTSYFQSRPSARHSTQRHSYPSQQGHSPYNMISPTHQVDHDAALRASLSTLLSCAAAARGLPKSQAQTTSRTAAVPSSSRVDPSTLRMVPESALPSSSPSPPATATKPPISRTDTTSAKSTSGEEKHKRRHSRDRRGSTKKARRAAVSTSSSAALDDSTSLGQVSPTLLTWVVSAGVVVLVSALSFSAGYVVGREAGRAEVEMLGEMGANASNVGSCAGEVVGRGGTGLGLRRLRFADAVRVS
ncbi:hypothetical protein B0J12DRAFT_397 [Macrophomina phaseolina]|uniref:Uncharacterized protein n=1 Tax=Macrophomina phaseolina TaxID=35725 RepID=A0ABQ8GTE0_9PEZI|nr:hypothetical protein B0J12DRAFT_397 [Macrophomina phaseolina]